MLVPLSPDCCGGPGWPAPTPVPAPAELRASAMHNGGRTMVVWVEDGRCPGEVSPQQGDKEGRRHAPTCRQSGRGAAQRRRGALLLGGGRTQRVYGVGVGEFVGVCIGVVIPRPLLASKGADD